MEDWEKLPESKNKKLIEVKRDIQNSFDKVKEAVQQLEYESNFTLENLNS